MNYKKTCKFCIYLILLGLVLHNNLYAETLQTHSHSNVLLGLEASEWNNIKSQIRHNKKQINLQARLNFTSQRYQQSNYLKSSNTEVTDLFGYSVAISGNTIVVSAVEEDGGSRGVNGDESDNSMIDSGAAYVFVKTNGEWQQQAYLKASNPGEGDWFGENVAIDGDTIVISAIHEDSGFSGVQTDNSIMDAGAVYVFKRENGIWHQEAYLKASNPGLFPDGYGDNQFGDSLAIYGDTIVVGSPRQDGTVGGVNADETNHDGIYTGSVYVFERNNGNWVQSSYIKAPVPEQVDYFGLSVAIFEDTIAVGSIYEDSVNSNQLISNSGAVYIYNKLNGVWSFDRGIQPLTRGEGDGFGFRVSLSENSLAVGVPGEASGATGINGDELNNDAPSSGAVYVFVKEANDWIQQAYIKASNTDAEDLFGFSTSLDNNTLIVGSRQESSSSVGTNGDEVNNLKKDSGAVYVFTRENNVWSQTNYLKASNADELDFFGASVAISNNQIIVGAYLEDSSAIGMNENEVDNTTHNAGAAYVFDIDSDSFPMQAAHSALWYNSEQSGHGINVYMLENNRVLVIWYVYDDNGNPLWLLGLGSHNGVKASLEVKQYGGAMFPPNFIASDVNSTEWGQFELSFSDCNAGLFKWLPVAGNGFNEGEVTIQRLTNTLGLACEEAGTTTNNLANKTLAAVSESSQFNQGISALWYNANQSGHGINVYLLGDNRILVIWYVYDNDGNPVWLLGVGEHDDDIATLDVKIGYGAMFPPNFNSADVQLDDWGSFELDFSSCNAGNFKWTPIAGNGYTAGEMSIERLTSTLGLSCPVE